MVRTRRLIAALAAVAAVMAAPVSATASGGGAARDATATPIQHVVVIFQENVSFDHYFGTYPYATNPPGEPSFRAAPGTPSVNGLTRPSLTAQHEPRATRSGSTAPSRSPATRITTTRPSSRRSTRV